MDTQKATQNNDLFTEGQLTQEDLQAVVGGQDLGGLLTALISETQNTLNSLGGVGGPTADAIRRAIEAVQEAAGH